MQVNGTRWHTDRDDTIIVTTGITGIEPGATTVCQTRSLFASKVGDDVSFGRASLCAAD
jgi:hypothetical protein